MKAIIKQVRLNKKALAESDGFFCVFDNRLKSMIGKVVDVVPEGDGFVLQFPEIKLKYFLSADWLYLLEDLTDDDLVHREKFFKSDLRTGHIVELRNEERYIVLLDSEPNGDIAINKNSWINIGDNMKDDLTSKISQKYDVMKVYQWMDKGGFRGFDSGLFEGMHMKLNMDVVYSRKGNFDFD